MKVSVWSTLKGGEYDDKIIYETDNHCILVYCGQRSHRKDKYIIPGALFFYKQKKSQNYPYIYKGKIISVIQINDCPDGTHRYEIIVKKENTHLFYKKEEALNHFNLTGDSIQHGIMKHN